MNFQDLIAKMTAIEEGMAPPVAPVHTDAPAQEEMALPIAIGGPAPQDNHVTMNISMNGTGADGVRNLMNILKDIEHGVEEPHMGHEHEPEEPLMGDMIKSMEQDQAEEECYTNMEEEMGDEGETWGNSAHGDAGAHVHGVDAVTFSGDDMNSKGKVSPLARAPGTNPLQHPMHESLVNRLSAMYQAIKEERTEEKDEKGNVVRWKEEGEWVKAKGKEGRGKVTNLSDKARRESEKMSKKDVKETAHHEDDEEKKIRHLMRKYGWSRQEALEHYHYEEHDPKDYEDMEESAINESNEILRLAKMLRG